MFMKICSLAEWKEESKYWENLSSALATNMGPPGGASRYFFPALSTHEELFHFRKCAKRTFQQKRTYLFSLFPDQNYFQCLLTGSLSKCESDREALESRGINQGTHFGASSLRGKSRVGKPWYHVLSVA